MPESIVVTVYGLLQVPVLWNCLFAVAEACAPASRIGREPCWSRPRDAHVVRARRLARLPCGPAAGLERARQTAPTANRLSLSRYRPPLRPRRRWRDIYFSLSIRYIGGRAAAAPSLAPGFSRQRGMSIGAARVLRFWQFRNTERLLNITDTYQNADLNISSVEPGQILIMGLQDRGPLLEPRHRAKPADTAGSAGSIQKVGEKWCKREGWPTQ